MLVVAVVAVVELVFVLLLIRKYKPIANPARAQTAIKIPKPIADMFKPLNFLLKEFAVGFILTRSIEL